MGSYVKPRKEFWDRLDEQEYTDVQFDARVLAGDLENDQDAAVRRSAGATAANKRRQADMLLGSLQAQKQPQQKKKRQQQQEHEEEDLLPPRFFDPTTITLSELEIAGIDIGKPSHKLPERFLPFEHLKNEDTHAHSALDALLTFVFPAYHHRYELHWANRPAAGSGDRRSGDAHKPDAQVTKDGFELGYVEVKPPKEKRHQRAYMKDVWALSGLAKDNIDIHLRHGRIITTVPCVLVFGFQMTLFQLSFQAGIYLWQVIRTSYLPRDQCDIGNIVACVELLKTFKAIMDGTETERYIRTPTQRVENDEELPDLYRPRPTNIAPSIRPFFSTVKRTSVSI
ncbi:hypothetical protein BGZ50_008088 [Haplosporangium sp. Z 11]|nr:hypothetical protein BGZ50_008088 [Haplosporangium sp. Z 11]